MTQENKALFPNMPKCWNPTPNPINFARVAVTACFKMLGEAIDELGIQDKTVFGCDIGCSLLSWDFFNIDSVQTHHGRTTPVMTGIKRARPELITTVHGDGGGYAIGSQHLVNAATRNEKVTVILVNNTNYGMTGGQMAPPPCPDRRPRRLPGRDPEQTGYPTLGPKWSPPLPERRLCCPGQHCKPASVKEIYQKPFRISLTATASPL